MRGIRTSIRTKSGFTWGANWTASSPLVATNTSCPANRRVKATKSRISRSSSAIKIFAMQSSLVFVEGQRKGERTAITWHSRAFHPNTALVHFHDLFNNGKSEAGSRRCQYKWMFAAIKALEHAVLIL